MLKFDYAKFDFRLFFTTPSIVDEARKFFTLLNAFAFKELMTTKFGGGSLKRMV